ncbi:MAG TPA: hypothetical protein VGR26_10480 [Acidimicrobiales bacterium]|nr:hypothetical protein [Acidimicrobiales bacterium]
MKDELHVLREARPHVRPPSSRVVESARSDLTATITNHNQRSSRGPKDPRPKRLSTGVIATVAVLTTAAAGWAVIPQGGNLPTPPFSGETWQLTVGEDSNGDGTYKVCRGFWPAGAPANDGNGLGGGDCETSPVEVPEGKVVSDVVPGVRTETGIVLLVDLTKRPVTKVVIETDRGESFEIAPFAMPDSGEQFVAVELPGDTTGVSVSAFDTEGRVIDGQSLKDLAVD